ATDRIECRWNVAFHLPGWQPLPTLGLVQDLHRVLSVDRWPTGQQSVERRSKVVNIACLTDQIHAPGSLLRTHVRRRTQRGAGLGFANLGQARDEDGFGQPVAGASGW